MKPLLLLSLLLAGAAGMAQPVIRPAPPDLPDDAVSRQLIGEEPAVVQTRHALEAARQRAQGLSAGAHEWTARGSLQQRRERSSGVDTREWTVGLERAIRVAGKAGIDRELGEAQLRLARARHDEARHEAARELLTLWLDWTAAQRVLRLWQEQQQAAQDNLEAVDKRRRAGDASRLELNSARVDLAEVQRQHSAARADEARARARLRGRFPDLSLQPVPDTVPEALGGELAMWRERILDESDALRIAREEARVAALQAARARADRVADPTLGVYASSERSGAERVVGLSFSMPIGGGYRRAQELESQQLAQAARAGVERRQRELDAEIAAGAAEASGSLERWRIAAQALEASRENLRLTQRAYALGEADLQTLLLARRQGIDAALGAEQARIDAQRVRYRFFVDAHLIWGLHDE